jgi:hypothetical protein
VPIIETNPAKKHIAKDLHQALQALGVRVALLASRSHELSPLDDGFFGVVDSK